MKKYFIALFFIGLLSAEAKDTNRVSYYKNIIVKAQSTNISKNVNGHFGNKANNPISGIVWTGVVDSLWNNPLNWSTLAVPTPNDTVKIPNLDITTLQPVGTAPGTDNTVGSNTAPIYYPYIKGSVAYAKSISIDSGAQLRMDTTLQLSGDMICLGTVSGMGTLKTTSISSTPFNTNVTWGVNIEYDDSIGGQTVVTGNYLGLSLNASKGGSFTASGNIMVGGVLSIPSGVVFDLSTYSLGGSFVTTGTGSLFTESTSSTPIPVGLSWSFVVDYNGTGVQTVVYGNYSTLTVSGLRVGNPAITFSPTNTIGIAGDFNYTTTGAIATTTGSTINFKGTSTQSIRNQFTFNNLTISNTYSSVIAAANITIGTGGTLFINATGSDTAVLDMGTNTLTLTTSNAVAGNGKFKTQSTANPPYSVNKTWTPTVWFNGTSGAQFVPGGTYNGGMIFTNGITDTATAIGYLTINGTLAIYSGSTLQMSGYSIYTSKNGTSISNPTTTFFTTGNGYLLTRAAGNGTQLPKYATWSFEVGYDGGSPGGPVNQRMVPGTYNILNADGLTPELKHFGIGVASPDTFLITGSMIYSSGSNYIDNYTTFKFTGTNQTIPRAYYYNLVLGTNSNFSPGTTEIIDSLSVGNTSSITNGNLNFLGNGVCNQIIPALNYDSIQITGSRGTYSVILAPIGYQGSGNTTIGVSGLFSNTSTYTTGSLVTTGSTINFNGTAAQTIQTANFYNLTINNGNGVNLSGNVNVSNNLSLINGIIVTHSNTISVTNTANNAIIGGSNNSFINGNLALSLASNISSPITYTFPLGDTVSLVNTYMPLSLVNPLTGNGAISITVQAFGSGNTLSYDNTLNGVSDIYWSFNPIGNFTSAYITLTSAIVTNKSLVALSTGGNSGTYTNIGGNYSSGTLTGTNPITSGVQTFAIGNLSTSNFPINYINDGGFEADALGTYSNITTNGGIINNTLAGQWQTNFLSPSSAGTSLITDSIQHSGNNSMELAITNQTYTKDVELIQVINSTTIPPAAPMVLTFYMLGGEAGDSVVANVFKSTAASNSTGISGDATQPANLYNTTNYWQMCKMYVDLSGWTTAERTNMRISIRPNSSTANRNPSGPYPKYYWFDDLSFKRIDTMYEMHQSAISVAIDRKYAALNAGFTAEANSIDNAINAMIADTNTYLPYVPTNAIGFNPPPTITDTTNPYIKALDSWAASYLINTVVTPSSKAVQGIYPSIDSRTNGGNMENLHWLIVSPYSKYRNHPELFRRYLTLAYSTSDDYQVNGSSSKDGQHDWFGSAGTCYGWWKLAQSFPTGYIPSLLLQRLSDASDTMGNYTYNQAQQIFSYNYTNRDVSYAQILMNIGLFRNNSTWIALANQIVDSANLSDRYPDGAYSYLGHQNECADYHGTNNSILSKIWAVSGSQTAWDCVSKTANYEILSVEPRSVPEFYTAGNWKSMWNGAAGMSGESLVKISGSGYYRTKLNQATQTAGFNSDVLSIAFYDSSVKPLPLPVSNYVVYDRNIQGPRGRYGNYSYAATLRNVAPKAPLGINVQGTVGEVGMYTIVGSMVTQPLSNTDQLDSIINSSLMIAGSNVHTGVNGNWGNGMINISPLGCVSRTAASVSTPAVLQTQYSGPAGRACAWSSNQHWITLPDRMIGYVETFPTSSTGTTGGCEITARLRFTYGRTGAMIPQTLVIDTINKQYTFGALRTIIHGYDFNEIDTVNENTPATPLGNDIVFQTDSSNGGTILHNYSGSFKKYFLAEIRNINATGDAKVTKISRGKLSGLMVSLNGNLYSSFRNDSTGAMKLDITSSIVVDSNHITQAHFARVDSTLIQPQIITSDTLILAAHQQVLIVSSSNLTDIGKGWENYTELLQNTGLYPATTNTVWNGGYNSSWTANANWSYGSPNGNLGATIPSLPNPPSISNTQTVNTLTVNPNVVITNSGNIQVMDSLTNNGAITGNGIVSLVGNNLQNITGKGIISNLTISNTNGATIASGSGNSLGITNTLNMNAGTLNTNGNLVIKSSKSNTASITPIQPGASISGNLTVERYIPAKSARKYSFISSPVAQLIDSAWQQQIFITGLGTGGSVCGTPNSNGFDVTRTNSPSLFTYYPQKISGSRWVSVPTTNATNLTPGIGYKVNIRGERNNGGGCNDQLNSSNPTAPDSVTLVANGSYNIAPTASVYGTNSYGSTTTAYTLLGNPYPCALSGIAFLNSNSGALTRNMWLYANNGNTNGIYGSWNNLTKTNAGYWPNDFSSDNSTDLVIPSGSAFFVERTANNDTIVNFTETQKAVIPKGTVTIFGSTKPTVWNNKVRFTLANTDSSFIDDAVVLYGNDAPISDTSYTAYDTYSLDTTNAEYISSIKKNYLLAMNTRKVKAVPDTVKLDVYSKAIKTYLLRFSDFQNFSATSIILRDKFLDTTLDIRNTPNYRFNTTADTNSYGKNRFELIINHTTTLAIHSINLIGTLQDGCAKLEWQSPIGQFINFDIEASVDGTAFKKMATETKSEDTAYHYLDCNRQLNRFYRVKGNSITGSSQYSNTIQLHVNDMDANFALYPNPCKRGEKLNIKIEHLLQGNYMVELIDGLGGIVYNTILSHNGANGTYGLLNNQPLAAGAYSIIIRSIDSGGLLFKKAFIVE